MSWLSEGEQSGTPFCTPFAYRQALNCAPGISDRLLKFKATLVKRGIDGERRRL